MQVITKASTDGTLSTRDWDTEPLFPIPNTDVINNEYASSLYVQTIDRCIIKVIGGKMGGRRVGYGLNWLRVKTKNHFTG